MKRVLYRRFRSKPTGPWGMKMRRPDAEAAAFASMIGEERLISISSENGTGHGVVVTIWYWSNEYQPQSEDERVVEKVSRLEISAEKHQW